jgi:hypothetical protein
MNFHTMRLVEQYYKSMCFLTMVPVQPQLEGVKVTVTVTPEQRELEESLNAAAATSDPPAEEGKAARRGRRGSGKSAAAGEKPE